MEEHLKESSEKKEEQINCSPRTSIKINKLLSNGMFIS